MHSVYRYLSPNEILYLSLISCNYCTVQFLHQAAAGDVRLRVEKFKTTPVKRQYSKWNKCSFNDSLFNSWANCILHSLSFLVCLWMYNVRMSTSPFLSRARLQCQVSVAVEKPQVQQMKSASMWVAKVLFENDTRDIVKFSNSTNSYWFFFLIQLLFY